MLVTRANNQSYEEGWQKEEKLELGKLVIERVVKARLLGHPAEGLICWIIMYIKRYCSFYVCLNIYLFSTIINPFTLGPG